MNADPTADLSTAVRRHAPAASPEPGRARAIQRPVPIPPRPPLRPIAAYLLALADATRLRIVFALGDGARSVQAIAAGAHVSRDRVSRQLALLRHAGLLACRRERGILLYRLTCPDVFEICDAVRSGLENVGSSERRTPDVPPIRLNPADHRG